MKNILLSLDNALLLGDSGYGIAPYLLTPFSNPTTPTDKYFNKVYASERVTVERCFGQVKMRFPILHYKVRTKLSSVGGIIICCFILHNVAKYLGDADDFDELVVQDEDEVGENLETSDAQTRRLGQAKRNEIAAILYANRNN